MTSGMFQGHRFQWPALTLAAIMFPALAAPQAIGPDEFRARTQPYMPAPALTLRTQVELVEVPVVVRDRRHKAVPGLIQDNFAIYDSGRKQDITAFSVENFVPASTGAAVPTPAPSAPGAKPAAQPKADLPLRYVVLCFDDLAMDPASTMRAKAAARQFVKTALAPGDRMAVVTTAWPKSTEFTNDIPTLLALIEKVNPNSRMSEDASMHCPPIRAYEAYLLANNMDNGLLQAKVAEYRACAGNPPHPDSTVVAMARGVWAYALSNSKDTLRAIDGLVQGLEKIPGRRMILLASSGFLTGNLENDEDELITKALHAGVVINALGARGLYAIIPGGDASTPRAAGRVPRLAQIAETRIQGSQESAKDDGMAVLASGTGGTFFHDNNDLLRGFRELGTVPEVMYLLGFSPSEVTRDGRFHNLKVRLSPGNGYSVQARMGYTAPSRTAPAQPGPASKVDTEMMATDNLADLPARITWEPAKQKSGVTYVAHIDVGHLKLEMRQDRRVQVLTMVAVLRDAGGNLIAGERSDVELNLTDATFTRLAATGGLNISLTVKAPPGTYAVRGLLLDGIEGKMVTSSQQLQLQ